MCIWDLLRKHSSSTATPSAVPAYIASIDSAKIRSLCAKRRNPEDANFKETVDQRESFMCLVDSDMCPLVTHDRELRAA